jgi:translation elongation factor EF-1beta
VYTGVIFDVVIESGVPVGLVVRTVVNVKVGFGINTAVSLGVIVGDAYGVTNRLHAFK